MLNLIPKVIRLERMSDQPSVAILGTHFGTAGEDASLGHRLRHDIAGFLLRNSVQRGRQRVRANERHRGGLIVNVRFDVGRAAIELDVVIFESHRDLVHAFSPVISLM